MTHPRKRITNIALVTTIICMVLISLVFIFARPAAATPNNDNDNPSVGSSHTPQNTKHPHASETPSATAPTSAVSSPEASVPADDESETPSQKPSEAPVSSASPSEAQTSTQPSTSATAAPTSESATPSASPTTSPTSDISVPANESVTPLPRPESKVEYGYWMWPMVCGKVVIEQSRWVYIIPYLWNGNEWVLDRAHQTTGIEYRTQMLEDWQVIKNCEVITPTPSAPASVETSVTPVVLPSVQPSATTDESVAAVRTQDTLANTGSTTDLIVLWIGVIAVAISLVVIFVGFRQDMKYRKDRQK